MTHRLERWIPWMVAALPLAVLALCAVLLTGYFSRRLNEYAHRQEMRYFAEAVHRAQARTEARTADLAALIAYADGRIGAGMKKTLKERVDTAYDTAEYLYGRYRDRLDAPTLRSLIADALSRMVWEGRRNYIWVTDMKGRNLLSADPSLQGKNLYDYRDADGRYIIREEIETVRKNGSGFLRSRFTSKSGEVLLYVRRFPHFDWYLGSGIDYATARAGLQRKIVRMVGNILWEPYSFVMLYDGKGRLLARSHSVGASAGDLNVSALPVNGWERRGDLYVKREAAGRYGWQIVSGFDSKNFMRMYEMRSAELARLLEAEKRTVLEAAVVIALIVALFSLLLSRRINRIFGRYREQVRVRENALREFNATLEARVEEEVEKQRRSEKMLIQQSKMAAMGDMISMIAHQWRQPLNSLSYMLMNIEGAYEHRELSEAYLRSKLAEAEKTLGFMSHTINDFRDFFRPDKAREEVDVSACVRQTLGLIEKSFAAHGIGIETALECQTALPLYRNELIQVLINLLQNAKDALISRRIGQPRVEIACYETGQFVVVRICDNAGGVDGEVAERIFEPYFSTKEKLQGTGLGLYMSRTIVEEHFNGEIVFENRGEGACFFVKIGRHQPEEERGRESG